MKIAIILCLLSAPVFADAPEIQAVRANGDRFDVTILHPDSGWDHYADGWEVLDAQGKRLGFRELFHPHKNEQPFTRSQTGISVPDSARVVYVRARCNVDGWSDDRFTFALPD